VACGWGTSRMRRWTSCTLCIRGCRRTLGDLIARPCLAPALASHRIFSISPASSLLPDQSRCSQTSVGNLCGHPRKAHLGDQQDGSAARRAGAAVPHRSLPRRGPRSYTDDDPDQPFFSDIFEVSALRGKGVPMLEEHLSHQVCGPCRLTIRRPGSRVPPTCSRLHPLVSGLLFAALLPRSLDGRA